MLPFNKKPLILLRPLITTGGRLGTLRQLHYGVRPGVREQPSMGRQPCLEAGHTRLIVGQGHNREERPELLLSRGPVAETDAVPRMEEQNPEHHAQRLSHIAQAEA